MLRCGSVVAGDQIHGDFVQELSGKDAEPGRAHARGMHCGGGRCVNAYTFIGRFLGAAVVVGDKGRCSGCGGGGLYATWRGNSTAVGSVGRHEMGVKLRQYSHG